jgi:hypothetical protein
VGRPRDVKAHDQVVETRWIPRVERQRRRKRVQRGSSGGVLGLLELETGHLYKLTE